jgi:hypothetical protein
LRLKGKKEKRFRLRSKKKKFLNLSLNRAILQECVKVAQNVRFSGRHAYLETCPYESM